MATLLRDINVDEISFVDKGASGDDTIRPRVVLFKRKITKESPIMDIESILTKLTPEEQDYLKQIMAKAAPADPPKPGDELAKALAALPAEIRKALEDAETAKVEKAKADESEKVELQKRVAKMEEERELESFEKRAAAELSHLPGMSTAEMAKVLRSVSKSLTADEFKKLEASLKAASEAVKKSALFGENGSSAGGAPSTAYAKIQAVAKSLKDKHPELSLAQAVMKATEAHPELAAEYQKENV